MITVAWRNLTQDKMKGVLSVLGVAMSAFLIFTVYGVFSGIDSVMEASVTGAGADIWITQIGTSGSLHSPSILPLATTSEIDDMDGAIRWSPLIRMAVSYEESDGNSTLLFLNGFDRDSDLGAPWKVVAGSALPQEGEIVLDRVFAKNNSFTIGDGIELRGRSFKIVGLADRTNIMVGFFAFVTFEDAASFLGDGLINSVLISITDGNDAEAVKASLAEQMNGVSVRSNDDMVKAYKDEVIGSFVPILLVLSVISAVVGILSVGLLIYMLTLERSKEYGIIKAIGGTNGYLYRIVLLQALVISLVGYGFGAAVSFPLISLIQNRIPEFVASLSLETILWGIPVFLAAGILASLVPIKRLVKIDPATAFQK